MIRMLDGKIRAMLSDRYRILDNYDLAFSALEVAKSSGADVMEASLSDRTMRIKFVSREIWDTIESTRTGSDSGNWYAGGLGNQKHLSRVAAKSRGDLPGGPGTVHPLVTIGNSETGHGSLYVRIGILAGICFNLATVEDVAAKTHLGGRLDAGLYSNETQAADSKAIYLKIRDSIKAAFNPEHFRRIVERAKAAKLDTIEAPTLAVAQTVKRFDLTEEAEEGILEHFLRDYSQDRYGLAQAVSRFAQDVDDGDAAADLEQAAGLLISDRAQVALA